MAIGLINTTILKPSLSVAAPQTTDTCVIPLTVFDKAAFNLHVVVVYAFKPPMPSNEVLKTALSDVLNHFPHLAGRLKCDTEGNQCIILNSAGVRIIETYVPTTLAEQLPFDPSKELNHLLPPVEGVEELLQIQLNRYACGGLVIGQTAHHRVADGQSMSSFFVTWARLVRGLGIDTLPFHDRSSVSVPRAKPRVEFDHHLIEFGKAEAAASTPDTPVLMISSFENLITHFSNDFVNKLKAKVVEENLVPQRRHSTFECLLAHIWKRVTQSRGLNLDEFTQVRVAVNGRARIKPPVPLEYFGNLVLWAYPRLTVREVLMESHTYVAKAIHDAVTKIDDKYFQSFIDFGELCNRNGQVLDGTAPEIGNTLCPNLEVDSWLRFQFHDLDFGGGGPCAFYPPNIPVEGLLIFLPSCREGGGVDVVMSLLPEHAHLFNQISHYLD